MGAECFACLPSSVVVFVIVPIQARQIGHALWFDSLLPLSSSQGRKHVRDSLSCPLRPLTHSMFAVELFWSFFCSQEVFHNVFLNFLNTLMSKPTARPRLTFPSKHQLQATPVFREHLIYTGRAFSEIWAHFNGHRGPTTKFHPSLETSKYVLSSLHLAHSIASLTTVREGDMSRHYPYSTHPFSISRLALSPPLRLPIWENDLCILTAQVGRKEKEKEVKDCYLI